MPNRNPLKQKHPSSAVERRGAPGHRSGHAAIAGQRHRAGRAASGPGRGRGRCDARVAEGVRTAANSDLYPLRACGHPPGDGPLAELYGKTLDEVAALYPEWRITEFGASLIKMEQQPDMFCPDHMVLMPNGAGVLCVFQNKYGDGLALVNELDLELSALPSAIQEDLRHGMGFSTLAELEQWLESVES